MARETSTADALLPRSTAGSREEADCPSDRTRRSPTPPNCAWARAMAAAGCQEPCLAAQPPEQALQRAEEALLLSNYAAAEQWARQACSSPEQCERALIVAVQALYETKRCALGLRRGVQLIQRLRAARQAAGRRRRSPAAHPPRLCLQAGRSPPPAAGLPRAPGGRATQRGAPVAGHRGAPAPAPVLAALAEGCPPAWAQLRPLPTGRQTPGLPPLPIPIWKLQVDSQYSAEAQRTIQSLLDTRQPSSGGDSSDGSSGDSGGDSSGSGSGPGAFGLHAPFAGCVASTSCVPVAPALETTRAMPRSPQPAPCTPPPAPLLLHLQAAPGAGASTWRCCTCTPSRCCCARCGSRQVGAHKGMRKRPRCLLRVHCDRLGKALLSNSAPGQPSPCPCAPAPHPGSHPPPRCRGDAVGARDAAAAGPRGAPAAAG